MLTPYIISSQDLKGWETKRKLKITRGTKLWNDGGVGIAKCLYPYVQNLSGTILEI